MAPVSHQLLAQSGVCLEPGETVIWSGRPLTGIRLGPGDLLLVPFSILWGGGVVVSAVGAWRDAGVHPLILLPLLPFIALAVYLVFGRFFADAWARARTVYLLTNERVIISAPRLGPRVLALPLDSWQPHYRSWSGNLGFISFQPLRRSLLRRGRYLKNPPKFAFLEQARSVYDQIRDLQRIRGKKRRREAVEPRP